MKKVLMILCDKINLQKEEFIKYLSSIVYDDQVDTAVLVGTKEILGLIREIKEYYNHEYSQEININVLILQNMEDTDYIFSRFKFKIKEFPYAQILINITHGSNKLSAISMLVSKMYGLRIQDRLHIEDSSKFENFDVIEQNEKNSNKPMYYIKKLFNNYDYKLAKEVLYDNYDTMDKTEQMFETIIEIYEKWDSFDYERYDFNKIESYFSNLKEIKNNYEAITILTDRNNDKYNSYRIADLINNAKRRIDEERYDDAIIRLYRVLELIGESELQEKYGIRKDDIHLDDINGLNIDKTAKINIKKRLDFKYPRYQIPLTTTYFILQKLYDKVGLYYSRNKQKYQELFQKRNVSVLVHGNHKYETSEIKEMLQRVTDLAGVYDENIQTIMLKLDFPKFKI
ncbi:hypothetical protein PXD04_07545 [Methanosphaera sp. ISO3-F5]|uniref:hypothetical protein n=1 Tax=Methanosphaera sp. ISO3-F5 TaxID=1452353 RepID=UPI002B257F29|nr:hypothetical protein [Methanosphaera sp. ISO3-F5]WQH63550.1 hypothetical protein PXD04_07545 [Methanosphaera sp. ISO3-F5]